MGWHVWADNWESGELANTSKFQTMRFNGNYIVKAFRTWVVVVDDPVFTSLNMKIYSNEVVSSKNTVKKLLHTSTDVRTKAEIITLENGVKEIYFTFNDIPVQANTYYNIVINGIGYLPTSTSYLAWMKAFPDTIYGNNYTPAIETINYAPYQIYAIGSTY